MDDFSDRLADAAVALGAASDHLGLVIEIGALLVAANARPEILRYWARFAQRLAAGLGHAARPPDYRAEEPRAAIPPPPPSSMLFRRSAGLTPAEWLHYAEQARALYYSGVPMVAIPARIGVDVEWRTIKRWIRRLEMAATDPQ